MKLSTPTKVEQVRQAVLEQIFKRELRPGDRLVEARLASDLGVAQATINSALQDLHSQGVVTKVLNRSTNVSRYSRVEIENLFAVRLVLEPAAARAASAHCERLGLVELEQHLDGMRVAARTGNLARFCLADYSFHQQIFQLTRNPFLIQACEAIAAAPFAYILCDGRDTLPTNYVALAESHVEVIRSLEQGPDAAERVIRERILEWREHSVRSLEASVAAPAAGPGAVLREVSNARG